MFTFEHERVDFLSDLQIGELFSVVGGVDQQVQKGQAFLAAEFVDSLYEKEMIFLLPKNWKCCTSKKSDFALLRINSDFTLRRKSDFALWKTILIKKFSYLFNSLSFVGFVFDFSVLDDVVGELVEDL